MQEGNLSPSANHPSATSPKEGGDSPTLALPLGPKLRKPVRLFWFVELTQRNDANCKWPDQKGAPRQQALAGKQSGCSTQAFVFMQQIIQCSTEEDGYRLNHMPQT
ncbi:hypothetical protein ABG768_017659 [Culter alburnus]|uniref:Uncharacterized protein n=1 Tax=Culter alburnus TaxID=194366 RepID=A0AAW1YYL9_CULAL